MFVSFGGGMEMGGGGERVERSDKENSVVAGAALYTSLYNE
jgi:hypothetical protein